MYAYEYILVKFDTLFCDYLSLDVHSRIVLRHVDPMELSARCDTEVFRTIHEIFQVPVAIVSLAIECQLILFSTFHFRVI